MSNVTTYQLFINGSWRGGSGTLTVTNPATEKVFGSVAAASASDPRFEGGRRSIVFARAK
ncbi:hypothetical protein [Mesorhizobium sp. M0800]|uniref:hypothetical protein n=1 Tax=Mesorhizobium sp. M0800 TaxID=2957000 RepID=UPI003334B9C6